VSLKLTDFMVNKVPQKGIFVRNGASDFVFGTTLSDEAKQFIAAMIMKEAGQL
jgi:hypothetical protein